MPPTRRWISWGSLALVAVLGLVSLSSCDGNAFQPETSRPGDGPGDLSASQQTDGAITGELEDVLAAADQGDTLVVVVTYETSVTSGEALAGRIMGMGAGARALAELPFVGAYATPDQVRAIADLEGVVRIDPNRRMRFLGPPAPAATLALLLEKSISTIAADAARAKYGVSGAGTGVAILDTGVDGTHPDLAFPERTVQNVKMILDPSDGFCFEGEPCPSTIYVENVENSDTQGHGTHVAGIAAGDGTASDRLYTGVAPAGDVLGIATGEGGFLFWVLAGFDYILVHQDDYNLKVVNNSWGPTEVEEFDPEDPVNVATREVHDAGITVVFAAGNDGPGEDTMNQYALAPWTIGVAAACADADTLAQNAHCSGGRLADFSSRGVPGHDTNRPDVTAPGVHITAARATVQPGNPFHDVELTSECGLRLEYVEDYTCLDGTSMAAPHVAGVVALMQERAGGKLSPDKIREILVKTADAMEGYAPFEVGAGMVNALDAVARSGR